MKLSAALVAVALLATPLLVSEAKADNVTANQLSAAGHGRQATMSNRPSRAIYHRQARGRAHMYRRHHRYGY